MDTNGTVAVSFSFGESGGCRYAKMLSLLQNLFWKSRGEKKKNYFLSVREMMLCRARDCFVLPSNPQTHLRSRGIKCVVCFAFFDRSPI